MKRFTAFLVATGAAAVLAAASVGFVPAPGVSGPQQANPGDEGRYNWPQSQAEFDNRAWKDTNKPAYPVHGQADNLEGPYQQTPLNQLY